MAPQSAAEAGASEQDVPPQDPPQDPPPQPDADVAAQPTDATEPAEERAPEDKPRARFSWETGTLEPAGPAAAPGAEATDLAETLAPAAPAAAPETPTEAPFPPTPQQQADAAAPAIPFMWNLSPTDEPDPAVNPHAAIAEPAPSAPEPVFRSAVPLVVPKPLMSPEPLMSPDQRTSPDQLMSPEQPVEPVAPQPAIADPAAPELVEPEPVVPELVAPEPVVPEPVETEAVVAEPVLPAPVPARPVAPEPVAVEPAPPADVPPSAEAPFAGEPTALITPPGSAGPAPLPPGTTAQAFDPFTQDLFNPHPEITTPVPSVDEFTIPDEQPVPEASAQVSDAAPQGPDEGMPGAQEHITSDWSDIAAMFGADPVGPDTAATPAAAPVHIERPAVPVAASAIPPLLPFDEALAPAPTSSRVPARPAVAPLEHSRGGGMNRWLLFVAALLAAVLIAIGLFALGRAAVANGNADLTANVTHTNAPKPSRTPASTPSQTPTSTSTPTESTVTVPPTGTLPAGQSYEWDQLRGGECVDPFTTPWAQQFAVVDCNAAHTAQLVYTAPFSNDPAAAFPGEDAIASQINLLCSKPGIVDLNAAAAYNDVQLVGSYPVTQDQWTAGQRNYYCFVTRSSGQQFTSSIAGPGPTQ